MKNLKGKVRIEGANIRKRWISLIICAKVDLIFSQGVFGFSTSFGLTDDPNTIFSVFLSSYYEEVPQKLLYIRHPVSDPNPTNFRKGFLPIGENNELVMVFCFLEKVKPIRERRENILIVDIVIWRLLIVSIFVLILLKLRFGQENKKYLLIYITVASWIF